MEVFTMKTIFRIAVAATLTSALALAAVTPSQARDGRNAAVAIGVGAGVLAGAAIASSNGYYGPGYYGAPGYAYGPAYDDGYYAYEPAPVYAPAPTYYYSGRQRSNGCGTSPASMNGGQPC